MKKTTQILSCAILVLLICSIAACQPTPDEPVIVNKNDGKLEEKLHESLPPEETIEPYEAPVHWSETVEGEKLAIAIDTDVKLPDVVKYPVVKVEPTAFTQQQVDEMAEYFAEGKKLYLSHVMTKADYDEMIIDAKRGQEVDGKFVVTDDSKEWVKELEEKRAAAPDESPKIYVDTALTYWRDYETGKEDTARGKNFLNVMIENTDGADAQISVSNYEKEHTGGASFYFSTPKAGEYLWEEWHLANKRDIEGNGNEAYKADMAKECHIAEYDKLFENMTLKKEDALAKTEKAIKDLGIQDLALVRADKTVSLKYPDEGGYVFEYMRQSGDISGFRIMGGGGSYDEQPPQYYPPFQLESLTIMVTVDGIQQFSWSGVSKVMETVSENVGLRPFEKIQQDLKDQIKYKKSFFDPDEYRYKDYTVKVISAELRMGYINVRDDPDRALMVPVWVFGTKESYLLDLTGVRFEHDSDQYVLSAIDGGVIEMARPQRMREES